MISDIFSSGYQRLEEHGEQDIPNDQHGLRRKQLDEARQRWASIAERMDEALSKEISTVPQRIRQLEQIAIGGALDQL